MRVLVACEFTGTVRDAFLRHGHDAMSCDLRPSSVPGPHYEGDVRDVLYMGEWDLMIAHPPCRHLAISGALWFKDKKQKQEAALDFVRLLMFAPIKRIAIENPMSVISTRIKPISQMIQPWEYGHPEAKTTCLWLKNLPLLKPTDILPLPACGYWENQTPSRQNKLGESKARWEKRARTYPGIAEAMAQQWGSYDGDAVEQVNIFGGADW